MKKLFPIFVLSCIALVVIGSRASRPVPNVATSAQAGAKTGVAPAVEPQRQLTAHAAKH